MRPFLPPLLAGALARANAGIDFDGTDYSFLERPAFLAAVLGLAALSYWAERLAPNDRGQPSGGGSGGNAAELPRSRDLVGPGLGLVALPLGSLLFAGSLADHGHAGWPGLIAGVACAALAYLVSARLLGRARRRLDEGAARLLPVWADAAALAVAGLSVLAPPVGFVAVAALVVLLVRGRGRDAEKYEGLRILR